MAALLFRILCILCIFWNCDAAWEREVKYRLTGPELTVYNVTVAQQNNGTRVQCAIKCTTRMDCYGFNYDQEARLCNIHGFGIYDHLLFVEGSNSEVWNFVQVGQRYYTHHPNKTTWSEAIFFCQSKGMKLPRLENEKEVDDLLRYSSAVGVSKPKLWVSANDRATEGVFVYADDNSPATDDMWAMWLGIQQPDNHVDGEDCVTLRFDTKKWQDVLCGAKKHTFCVALVQ